MVEACGRNEGATVGRTVGRTTVGIITALSVGLIGCSSREPSGVVSRSQLATSCALAGVQETPARSDTSGDESPRGNNPPSIDDEFARYAEVVPGGFGGSYLDDRGRLVVVLVDPSKRDTALAALESLRGDIAWSDARVIKGDYDFAQLKRYFDRLIARVGGGGILSYDIDEVTNRIVLGVIDEAERRRVALEIVALDDVPCGAVVIELEEIGTLD